MPEPVIIGVSPPEHMGGMRPEELTAQFTALLVHLAVQGAAATKRPGGKLSAAAFAPPTLHALAAVRDQVPHAVWEAAGRLAEQYVAAAVDMRRPVLAVAMDVRRILGDIRDAFGGGTEGVKLGQGRRGPNGKASK